MNETEAERDGKLRNKVAQGWLQIIKSSFPFAVMIPSLLLLMCSIIKLIQKIYMYKALAIIMCLLKCGPWLLQKIWHPRSSIHHTHDFCTAPTVRIFSLTIVPLRQSTTGRNNILIFQIFCINCISNIALKI